MKDMQKENNIAYQIERLLNFARVKGLLCEYDVIPSRNALMDLLKVDVPYKLEGNDLAEKQIDERLETALPIMVKILDYCVKEGITEDTVTQRDLMDARIMGLVMPPESVVVKEFKNRYLESPQLATEYLYTMSRNANYIQVDRINKNLYWKTQTDYGQIEITVNLSKPEKDPREIASAGKMKSSGYPKCLLCKENLGFAGNLNHPARQNIRIVPMTLNEEQWFLQYSPYLYYNEHCIVLCNEHRAMKMTRDSFKRLFDFVDQFPHYFIGSNADLPIVGGSILSHDHYQGGRHTFAMEKAKSEQFYSSEDFKNVNISRVKWPMSVIRISGENKEDVVNAMDHIFEHWKTYSDVENEILAFSDETPHNTVTPIVRKNKDGLFEGDVVLRNNRTDSSHPLGIFHPRDELHHIKKENIGLIEVMGLAVLPKRLVSEMDEIKRFLTGEKTYVKDEALQQDSMLYQHASWIDSLVKKHGVDNPNDNAQQILQDSVGSIFLEVLMDAGVFKRTPEGMEAFNRFMLQCGFVTINK